MCPQITGDSFQNIARYIAAMIRNAFIKGCLACEYCHGKGQGTCIQKDDMQEIYKELKESEQNRLRELYDNWIAAKRSCKRGYVSQEDVDAAYNALLAYSAELEREYDYRC